jgi:hypothetical protein
MMRPVLSKLNLKYLIPITSVFIVESFDDKYKTECKTDYEKCNYNASILFKNKELIHSLLLQNTGDFNKIKRCFAIQTIDDEIEKMTSYSDFIKIIDFLIIYKELNTEKNKLHIINFLNNIVKKIMEDTKHEYYMPPDNNLLDYFEKMLVLYPSLKNNVDEYLEAILNRYVNNSYSKNKFIHHRLFQEYIFNKCVSSIGDYNKKLYYCKFLINENIKKLFNKYIDNFTYSEITYILSCRKRFFTDKLNLDYYLNYYLKKQVTQHDKNIFGMENCNYMSLKIIMDNVSDPYVYKLVANNSKLIERYITTFTNYNKIDLLINSLFLKQSITLLDCTLEIKYEKVNKYDKLQIPNGVCFIIICWELLKKNKLETLAGLINFEQYTKSIYIAKIYEYIYLYHSFAEFESFIINTSNENKYYCSLLYNDLNRLHKSKFYIRDYKLKDNLLFTYANTK